AASIEPRAIPVAASAARPSAAEGRRLKPAADASRPVLTPLTDIHEEPEGLLFEADIPGASDQSVTVNIENNVLTVQAQVQWPVPEGTPVLYAETQVGDYSRSFILSDEVDRSHITAELANGVLRVWMPRADRARPL